MSHEVKLLPPTHSEHEFGSWRLDVHKHHIMGSMCDSPDTCTPQADTDKLCNLCRYERLVELPSLPDMVFANNRLRISYRGEGAIEFNALDALRCVSKDKEDIQVAHAEAWKAARADCEFVQKVVKSYDWTYTTDYTGTLDGRLAAVTSQERIDLDKLRVHEEIQFYHEVFLYEDELDDNGSTRCVVKVRVMASGFFVVFRHYLRVDQVIVRVNDTRLYCPRDADYIIRETSTREAPVHTLRVDASVYKNPDMVWQYLPVTKEKVDKLVLTPI